MSLRLPAPDSIYEFGEFRFELGNSRLDRAGSPLHVQPKVLRVLAVLIENANALVDRDALFDEVWGRVVVTPGALTRTIRELRRLLDDDAGEPRFIETVHRRGYRWVAPVTRADTLATRARLPERTSPLIGREADLARLSTLLEGARLVTLAGPGGSGKTQLALELGRRLFAASHAVAWADLSPASDGLHCGRLVAAAVDVREREDLSLEVGLARAIGQRELVLLLDNCEVVVRPVASLARTLLAQCPALKIVSTSQVTLDVPDEVVHWVRPLDVPPESWDCAGDPESELQAFDAARLLLERARAIAPDFRVDRKSAAAFAAICRRLDGIPLALELAAARLAALTPQRLLAALDDRFGLLERRVANPEARHRSLAAAIAWSYGLLDAREQEALDALGVFAGSFSVEAALAVAGPEAGSSVDLLNVVQSLTQKSLLTIERGDSENRYRLLDSLKAFARARLRARDREAELQRRHCAFYAALSQEAGSCLLGADQVDWLERLALDWPNLTAAYEWARRPGGSAREALRLVSGLRWFFWIRGMYGEALQWFRGYGELASVASAAERAELLNGVAISSFHAARFGEATRIARDAAKAASEAGNGWELAFSHCLLRWTDAVEPRSRASSRPRPDGRLRVPNDPWLRAFSRMGVAFTHIMRDEPRKALTELEAMRSGLEETEDRHLMMFVLMQQALQYYRMQRYSEVRPSLVREMKLALELSNVRALAAGIECSAYLAIAEGDAGLGARLLGAAEAGREAAGSPLFPHWLGSHREAIEGVRRTLGESAVEEARAAGRKLPARDSAVTLIQWHQAALAAPRGRRSRAGRSSRSDHSAGSLSRRRSK